MSKKHSKPILNRVQNSTFWALINHELSIDLILAGLPYSFAQFVLNYRMNDKATSIHGLINLLKIVKPTLKKEGKVVMLVDSYGSKKSSKNKIKRKITK